MAYGVPVARSSPSRSTADVADPPPGRRADVAALAVVLALIAGAVVAGYVLRAADIPIHAAVAPLFGTPGPQASPATPAAVAVAGLAIAYGPAAADRARWRHLVIGGWLTSLAWVLALALVTGWERFATRVRAAGRVPHRGAVRSPGARRAGLVGELPQVLRDIPGA